LPYKDPEVGRAKKREYGKNNRAKRKAYVTENREQIRRKNNEWYEKNRDRINQKRRENHATKAVKYADLPEGTKEVLRRKSREAYARDAERLIQQSLEYRDAHYDAYIAYMRQYRIDHREEMQAKGRADVEGGHLRNSKRGARKKALPISFTREDQQFMLQYWGSACVVCGREESLFGLTLANDHWIPLTSADCPGTVAWNIVPLCHGIEGCNNSKGKKAPERWLKRRFGTAKAKKILAAVQEYFLLVRQKAETNSAA
jgi:hypothetical protein